MTVCQCIRKCQSLLFCIALFTGCNENDSKTNINVDLLIGHWNSYEFGTVEDGFEQIPTTSLTLMYESGIAFLKDGTFKARFHSEGKWTESEEIGTYEFSSNNVVLTFFPDTQDEFVLALDLIKLDENQLWFSHDHFVEMDYHLERVY